MEPRSPITSLSHNGIPRRQESRRSNLYRVVYDYDAQNEDELTLRKGDLVVIMSKDIQLSGDEGWWVGQLDDRIGILPSNFVVPASVKLNGSLSEIELTPIKFEDLLLCEVIGRGGFGKVQRGFWGDLEVAVKIAFESPEEDISKVCERVRKEAIVFTLLQHEHIVSLYGVCLEPPNPCLILEYARGGPMNRALQKSQIEPLILLDWSRQIAEGMCYLHHEAPIKLIHRDLKSSNILIREEIISGDLSAKTLKITDFGLAKEYQSSTQTSMAGTYPWMSPEVIREGKHSTASDVWSFGVVVWELLTGETPFKGMDIMTVAYQVGIGKRTLPLPSSCPVEWKDLITRCWERAPERRPNFIEILQHLDNLAESTWVLTTPQESFHTQQAYWRSEIGKYMKKKEEELVAREEQLRLRELMVTSKEEMVKQRELDLLFKELNAAINQATPTPKKRKSKRSQLRYLKKDGAQKISRPVDFRPLVSVRREGESGLPLMPSFVVSCDFEGSKNKTWSPASSKSRERAPLPSRKKFMKSASTSQSTPSHLAALEPLPSFDAAPSPASCSSTAPAPGNRRSLRKDVKRGLFSKAMEDFLQQVAVVMTAVAFGKDVRSCVPRNTSSENQSHSNQAQSLSGFNTYHGHSSRSSARPTLRDSRLCDPSNSEDDSFGKSWLKKRGSSSSSRSAATPDEEAPPLVPRGYPPPEALSYDREGRLIEHFVSDRRPPPYTRVATEDLPSDNEANVFRGHKNYGPPPAGVHGGSSHSLFLRRNASGGESPYTRVGTAYQSPPSSAFLTGSGYALVPLDDDTTWVDDLPLDNEGSPPPPPAPAPLTSVPREVDHHKPPRPHSLRTPTESDDVSTLDSGVVATTPSHGFSRFSPSKRGFHSFSSPSFSSPPSENSSPKQAEPY